MGSPRSSSCRCPPEKARQKPTTRAVGAGGAVSDDRRPGTSGRAGTSGIDGLAPGCTKLGVGVPGRVSAPGTAAGRRRGTAAPTRGAGSGASS